MEFVPVVAMIALVWKSVDFLRFAVAQDWPSVTTQGTAWVGGVLITILVANTTFAGGISFGEGVILGEFSLADQVFFGLGITSMASGLVDFKKARDNTDTAHVPSLF